ncbi:MAG: hypothetical protein NTX50_14560 [Candidatus Sumerlaeota bacterium]|nr:hypothetical protein [Candidatus Sumerlaeota bacterium]
MASPNWDQDFLKALKSALSPLGDQVLHAVVRVAWTEEKLKEICKEMSLSVTSDVRNQIRILVAHIQEIGPDEFLKRLERRHKIADFIKPPDKSGINSYRPRVARTKEDDSERLRWLRPRYANLTGMPSAVETPVPSSPAPAPAPAAGGVNAAPRERRSNRERRSGIDRRKKSDLIFRNRRYGGDRRAGKDRRRNWTPTA